MDEWDALPWHEYETYLEYLQETGPGGVPYSTDDRATVLARSYVDEAPAPPEPAAPAAAGPPPAQPDSALSEIRSRYRITTVSGFGTDAA